MKRKAYEVPTMDVVEVKQQAQLLAGSGPLNADGASIDDYEDGVFNWGSGSGAPKLDIEKGEFTW